VSVCFWTAWNLWHDWTSNKQLPPGWWWGKKLVSSVFLFCSLWGMNISPIILFCVFYNSTTRTSSCWVPGVCWTAFSSYWTSVLLPWLIRGKRRIHWLPSESETSFLVQKREWALPNWDLAKGMCLLLWVPLPLCCAGLFPCCFTHSDDKLV
jgi:hypothetical protein